MAEITTNKLLPLLGCIALLVLAFVIIKAGLFSGEPEKVQSSLRTTLPTPGDEPDADTPADTIRALQGEMAKAREDYVESRASNKALEQENRHLEKRQAELRSEMKNALEQEIEASEDRQSADNQRLLGKLQNSMDRLKRLMDAAPKTRQRKSRPDSDYADIPVGFGLDRLSGRGVIWVTPLDASTDEEGKLMPAISRAAEAKLQPTAPVEEPQEPTPEPYFTIPNLSSLVGSTSFTSMIGRVPIGGQVRDPIPFRVLVGRENLAASGLRVPNEIAGMVFEGTAIGDWTLSCVEGSLHTATFVFEDGTIRTVSTVEGGNNARPNVETERLGFIADKFGNPCITGRKISNWKELTALRVGLKTASAAAEAAAASETSTVIGGATGAITNSVDGSKGDYVLGRAVSEGIDEVDQAIADRLSHQFDAIFVGNGQELGLLIQKQISIDYDSVGRKLDHATATIGTRRSSYLD